MVRQAEYRLSVTVDRARAVCEAIDGRSFDGVEALLDRVGLLLGRTVSIGPRPDGDGQALTVPAGPIDGTDRSGGWLWTERPGDADANALLEMVLWRVAAETTRLTDERARRAGPPPLRRRGAGPTGRGRPRGPRRHRPYRPGGWASRSTAGTWSP